MLIKITFVTRCTRPSYLLDVMKSIFNNSDNFDVRWVIMFDTYNLRDIDSDILTQINSDVRTSTSFIKGDPIDFGHNLLNISLDKIDDGWVYFLDDDNILHPDFYNTIYNQILNNLDKSGIIFNQDIDYKDFTNSKFRYALPENVEVGKIDMAQFILRRDFIGDNRFIFGQYTADGDFIEKLFKSNSDKFIFLDKVLCYYNFLKKSGGAVLPKILFISEKDEELKSIKFADYESDELDVLRLDNDDNIKEKIYSFNPDCILTVGDDFSKYNELNSCSLDTRRKWIHLSEGQVNKGEIAYGCSMNYMLTNKTDDLISFFSPIYNTGDKLKLTYQSLRDQSYSNWEWVLVNDSTDEGKTLKVAEELAKSDDRIKLYDFRWKSKGVIGESKYRAASLCRGEILAELDHDDYLHNDCAFYLNKAQQKYPDVGFFYSDCVEVNDNWESLTYGDGFGLGYGSYRDEIHWGLNMKVANSMNINPKTIRHIVGVPNHIRAWRRSAYHDIGGHCRRLSIADDYELIVRTFLKIKMMRIPKMLYVQFLHNSGSNTHNLSRKDIQRRVRTISSFYNDKIYERFMELGLTDWAYLENKNNPIWVNSRYGSDENYANLIFDEL